MPEVVQLRIHGVGGNPADALLGLTKGAAIIRVAGDEKAGFYARPEDPHVQCYEWWRLTSGSGIGTILQALWIVLLPFTLFNVANWMFPGPRVPPKEKEAHRRVRVTARIFMFLLGLSLTLSYLLWEYALVVQQVAYRWLGGWPRPHAADWLKERPFRFETASPLTAVIVGMAGVVLLGIAVLFVALRTRRDFEKFPGPEQKIEEPTEPRVPPLGHPLSPPERLDDPSFWSRPKASKRLLTIHLVVGSLMFAGLVAWTAPRAHAGHDLGLHPWFTGLVGAQAIMVLVALVLYLVGWGWGTHFRWAPPIMVAALSVALTTGFFTGLAFYLDKRLKTANARFSLELSAVYGIGSGVFVASLIAWLVIYLIRWRRELHAMVRPPKNQSLRGAEPTGASRGMRSWIAFLRSISRGGERLDLLVTPGSAAFVVAALAVVVLGAGSPGRFDTGFLHFLVRLGRWELLTLIGIALPALLYRAFKPGSQSKVKSLWDATTFWPRRFHPFAVRPYGERAVPEIQGRIYDVVCQQHRRLVLLAHSQGAVLAHCALVHLARWDDRITRDVALVTFGNPIRRMHASYFPAYFVYPEDFDGLATHLFPAAYRCVGWRNFYHRTDYVGQRVLDGTESLNRCDCELPDPAELPEYVGLSVRRPWASSVDVPQPTFTKALVHSHYWESVELQRWVRAVERRLAR